jgi:hypothetical protein
MNASPASGRPRSTRQGDLPHAVPMADRRPLNPLEQRELETVLMQLPAELARGLDVLRAALRIWGPRSGRGAHEVADILHNLEQLAVALDASLPEVMARLDRLELHAARHGGGA